MGGVERRSAHTGHACCLVKPMGVTAFLRASQLGKCLRMVLPHIQCYFQERIYWVAVRASKHQDVEFAGWLKLQNPIPPAPALEGSK